jgi:hypothetical protein
MEQTYERVEKNTNPAQELLRKVLSSEQGIRNIKRFFDEHRDGEHYDLNSDSCRGLIHKAAATLIFLAYPGEESDLHLFPEGCDGVRQQFLFNAFYRAPISADQIVFPERGDIDEPPVIINGQDFNEAKKARVEKLGVSDLVMVSDPITKQEPK